MATETTADKKTRVRKARRNYERELNALKLYCEVSIETINDEMGPLLSDGSEASNSASGKLLAFERVLAKINAGGGA